MAKRKIYEDSNGSRTVKVWWDAEWAEYAYLLYENGVEQGGGFTDNKKDAIQTAQHLLKQPFSRRSTGGLQNNPDGNQLAQIVYRYDNIIGTDRVNAVCIKERRYDHITFVVVELETGKEIHTFKLRNFDFNMIVDGAIEKLDRYSPLVEDDNEE